MKSTSPLARQIIDPEMLMLLIDIGISGGWRGHKKDALAILEGLRQVQPKPRPLLDALHALMLLRYGGLIDAMPLVEKAAAAAPDDQFIKAVRALAYAEDGRKNWRVLAEEVCNGETSSEAAKEVAGLAIDLFAGAATPTTLQRPISFA